jgi:hypothetical protein
VNMARILAAYYNGAYIFNQNFLYKALYLDDIDRAWNYNDLLNRELDSGDVSVEMGSRRCILAALHGTLLLHGLARRLKLTNIHGIVAL